MTVGLVLGAGGALGWAYHLGVLEGVRAAIDRDPAEADRIVGTSAGAAIAATLLGGAPTDEVLELISTPPSEDDRERMRAAREGVTRNPLRALRPLAPGLVRRIGRAGFTTAAVGLLPSGVFPTIPLRRFAVDDAWPAPLWVPTLRVDDGEVVVFGRDPVPVSLGDAIEATSAMPALFQPKVIDGVRYIDGAVASATHADTLIPEAPGTVLISSPMTRPGRGPIRARARRQLAKETRALEAAGARTVVLEPDATVLAAAEGFPRANPGAGRAIVDAARRQTIAAFADSHPSRR